MLRITRQMAAGWRYSTAESESAARLAALGRTSVLVAGKRPITGGLTTPSPSYEPSCYQLLASQRSQLSARCPPPRWGMSLY